MNAKESIKLVHADSKDLIVVKRRVPVRIRTAEDVVLEGDLYADIQRLDGSQATIVDRLCDTTEAYLPIALSDTHVLLPKATIISALLPEGEVPGPCDGALGHVVRFHLAKGPAISGTIHTLQPPAHARLLDYLNGSVNPFLLIRTDAGDMLVNRAFVARVEEQHTIAAHGDGSSRRTADSPANAYSERESANRHVLIVEDDADFRQLLVDVFTGLRYHVQTLVDGASALDWLTSHRTDVVLLDLHLPGMSGIDVLRAVSRLSSRPPVIALSSATDGELAREALRIGADDCLSKPVDLRALQERVALATVRAGFGGHECTRNCSG